MSTLPRIALIVGSTRPGRFGIQPAQWLHSLTKEHEQSASFTLIDLQTVNLPFLDEAVPPVMQQYANEHTKHWAKTVAEFDGYILITPEYNHGYPAVLKNALDFAAKEWNYKPVSFVSYGAESGGIRAVEQLRQVVAWLRMYDLSEVVSIPNYWGQLSEEGKFVPTDAQADQAHKLITSVVFWSDAMREARKKLQTPTA